MIFTAINKKNNMNVVRFYLCLCIIMNHFNVLNDVSLPTLPRIFGGVGSFFAISGFLMFASYEKRPNLKGYFERRLRRILPPYVLIVLLSAITLSCVSTLPPAEYFTDNGLYKYILANLCFLNFIEPSLPGVFSSNHITAVNGSLWTMKGEVVCYLSVPLIYAYIHKHPRYVTHILASLGIICFSIYVALSLMDSESQRSIIPILAKQFRVFTFFFIGALINVHLDKLIKYKWIVLLSILPFIYLSSKSGILYMLLRPFTDSILVIWFCMIGSWGHYFSRYNSISYDMYLFHFPIIQTIISTGLIPLIGLWPALGLAVSLTIALAAISWRYVGKPILEIKKPLCICRR